MAAPPAIFMSLSTMTLAPPIAQPPPVPADFKRAWLLAPAAIWMLLFLLLPTSMMGYASFWPPISRWWIVLLGCLLLGYPVALYIGLFVRNKGVQTMLLVLCVIPFWTSF